MKDVILFVTMVIVVVTWLSVIINSLVGASCLHAYDAYQPQYSYLSGCRIMVEGKLTPVDMVREIK